MKAIIHAVTNNLGETSYSLHVGHQSFQFNYVYDGMDNDTASDQSHWYAGQLEIALKNAGCKEVEIQFTDLNK